SLGATLYDLLCERPPFADMPAIQLLLSIANLEPEPPSAHRAEIDPGLDALVLRCLAKEPADRYPSMEALAADLRAYLAEGASGVSALASARARSRRTVLGVAALGLLAAAAPFAILELLARDEPASSGAASPLPEATPGEAEVRLTLRPDAPLEVPPGASATFRVGPDLGGVRLGLRGPAETEVRVVGGGHERRLRCEADWELPLLLVRKAQLRPLSDGDYELKVDPQAAGPVEVRLGTWDNETKAPLPRREAWCVPELEECFRGEEALARAREVLETFARRRKEFGSRRGQLLGSRLYQRLRDLARTDGLPPAKLLLAVLGGYVFLDQAPESSPQRVALELVSANPDCFAVRWYAAEAISETEPRAASLHFRRCRELKPELPGPREWLLTTLAQAGEIEEFEREARQLVAMCPYNWKAQLAFLIATQRGDAAEAERCCAMLTTLGSRRLRPALAVIEGALRGLARAGKHDAARALARAFLDAQPALEASESLGGKGTRPWNRLVVCRATLHCEGRAAARKLWSVRETAAPLIYARWQALRQDIEGE
ncbi:MAG TPA: hypothetical protein DEA08_39595, partial [Planctomycetes bacterium]|nr:hypothetical protein [Planctomycetota bacterium]